MTDFGVISNQK